jgi:L-threonylcarbamoyladenylate synthase
MMAYSKEDMERALEVLRSGGLIIYPTDTIWGIGCDATNPKAVERVHEVKGSPPEKCMLVLLENPAMIPSYVEEVPEVAWELIDVAVKPTTIVFDGARNLATNLVGTDGSIGIRITNELFSSSLIKRFRKPIVSTSANRSGSDAPSCFHEIDPSILNQVDYVVRFKQEEKKPATPSTIIKLGRGGLIRIIRP